MAYQRQLLQLPFTGGVDQKIADEYQNPQTNLLDAQNIIWPKEGGADKRPGMLALPMTQAPSSDPPIGTIRRMLTRRNEVMLTDGDSMFTMSPSNSTWSSRGLVPECLATREHLYSAPAALLSHNVAEGGGLRAVVARTAPTGSPSTGDVFLFVFDATTGAQLLSSVKLTSGSAYKAAQVHIVQNGGAWRIYVFYWNPSNSTIYGQVIPASTLTSTGQTAIVTDCNGQFDSVVYTGLSAILIFYPQASGIGANGKARYLRLEALPSLVPSASAVISDPMAIIDLTTVRVDITNFGLAWFFWEVNSGGVFTFAAMSLNVPAWTVATTVFAPILPNASGLSTNGALGVEILTSTTVFFCIPTGAVTWLPGSGAVLSSTFPSGNITHKPFVYNDGTNKRCYVMFGLAQQTVNASNTLATRQDSWLLLDTHAFEGPLTPQQQPRPVAVVAPRQAQSEFATLALQYDNRFLQTTGSGLTAGPFFRAVIPNKSIEERVTADDYNIDLVSYDFSGNYTHSYAEADEDTFVSCGITSFYDSIALQEMSFLKWPDNIPSPALSHVVGSLENGTFGYAFCYAQTDASGLVHRSAFMTMNATTGMAPPNQFSFVLPNLPYTNRIVSNRTPVVEVYRTAVNASTYYFIGQVACVAGNNSATLAFVDGAASPSITSNPLLPTTGGVLDSVCPPSSRQVKRHGERLFLIDDTGFTVWFSTAYGQDETSDAPVFNEGLTISVSDGPLTALESMDSYLVLFTANKIRVTTGEGPGPTGQGSDFAVPYLVMSDVGAADWRSVIQVPQGVMFQAPSGGIYLLTRGLEVQFVGKAVQDWVGSTPVVSVALVPGTQQVRWILQGGAVICWDYVLNRWSRFVYIAFAAGPAPTWASSVVLNGTLYMAATDVTAKGVWREKNPATDAAPYQDTNSSATNGWVTSLVQTAHAKLAGLQGDTNLGHLMFQARFLDPCDVSATVTYDYGASGADGPIFYTYAALSAANSVSAQADLLAGATKSQVSAVQVTLSDAVPTGGNAVTGQGVRWLGLALDLFTDGERKMNIPATLKR